MRETHVDHRLDDRHLARKVVIEVPRTDSGFGADVRRAGAAEAVPGEAADRRAENLPALLPMLDGVDFPQGARLPSLDAPFSTTVRHEKIKIREFFFYMYADRRDLHSFPTRRTSA